MGIFASRALFWLVIVGAINIICRPAFGYADENGPAAVEKQAPVDLKVLVFKLDQLEAKVDTMMALMNQISEQISELELKVAYREVQSNPCVSSLRRLRKKRENLFALGYRVNHPDIEAVETTIEALKHSCE